MTDFVTVDSEEWEEIQEKLTWLECLERAGVDNWEGYDEAREMFAESYAEGEE